MSQGPNIVKMRFHRPKAQIEQNLEPLKQNRKKVAQRFYYQNHPVNISPLVNENSKAPVHQRLGLKQTRLKRLPLGTNTASLLPKRRQIHKNLQNGPNTYFNFRGRKLQRTYSAQARLERIRNTQFKKPKIKLRRLNTVPKNLTIELQNNNFSLRNVEDVKKFKMMLDPKIQAEIIEIQNESTGNEILVLPTLRIQPVTTGVSMHDRFTSF
ncbi:uncharacterized protein LOC115877491 [Sitophilus oryzae]|uniref:Uncharacterized protein LOC115877491 n=1 Tax=Sitophilus oryzae TaxID=7048 RepID=A0A6J2XFL9_SITOR|nr:uncharacterized protein LOC115877491 [Sitophilus oryzae]